MLQETTIKPESIVAKTQDHVASDIDGETVLMSVRNDKYYGMDLVGSHIWALLEQPIEVATLCRTLTQEYSVAPNVCEQETLAFLQELAEENLVQLVGAPA